MSEPAEGWRKRWQETPHRRINNGNQYKVCYVTEIGTGTRGVLKTLKEPERSERHSRLLREIEMLDQLRDTPNVPRLLDCAVMGSDPSQGYIVLEEIDGRPMSNHFQKAVGLEEAVRVTLLLSQVVQDCHRKGILHRDIKPDNILIEPAGHRVWLIDFGMVWAEASEVQSVTEAGQRGGNAFLRLPEMEPATVEAKRDTRSDITFTCGILFWLLTLTPRSSYWTRITSCPISVISVEN
jgi:serine/threonine protein kinase